MASQYSDLQTLVSRNFPLLRGTYHAVRSRFKANLYSIIDICNLILTGLIPIPGSIRFLVHGAARVTGETCAGIRSLPRIAGYKIIGEEWTIIVYGSETSKQDILHLFFKNGAQVQKLGRIPVWKLNNDVTIRLNQGADLVIYERPGCCFPTHIRTPISFRMPTWIEQEIHLPPSSQSLIGGKRNKSRRRYINRLREDGFVTELTRARADVQSFYYDIYVPYIVKRFGARALQTPFRDVLRVVDRGTLVKLTRYDRLVGGVICYCRGDRWYNSDVGILSGDPDLQDKRPHLFLSWQSIQYAYEQGAKIVNLGGTRPWLSDGVFQRKRLWGATAVRRNRLTASWEILARVIPERLRQHINELGLITDIKGNHFAVYLEDGQNGLPESELIQKADALAAKGLAGLATVASNAPIRTYISKGPRR